MDSLKLDQQGGAWIYEDTLEFMQRTDREAINAIVALLGDNIIVSGCVQSGSTISDGVMIIGGEVMPFQGGRFLTNVAVQETVTKEQFEDGTQKDFYIRRKAIMTLSAGTAFADFVSIKALREFRQLPTVATSDYSAADANKLATIKAVADLRTEVFGVFQQFNKIITMFTGLVSEIPAGWQLCDGTNGTIDLRDRFVVGAGNDYAVGATGGSNTKTIAQSNLPASLNLGFPLYGETGSNGHLASGGNDSEAGGSASFTNAGGGQPIDIRPLYYAVCFIERISI